MGRGEIKRLETPESRDGDKKHDSEPPLWSALLKLHICISFMLTMSPEANYRYPCFLDEVQRSRVTRLREQSWAMQSPCPAWASSRTTGKVCTCLRTFRLKLDRHPDGLAEEGTGMQMGLFSLVPIRMESLYNWLRIPGQVPTGQGAKPLCGPRWCLSWAARGRNFYLGMEGGGWQISGDAE